MINIVYILALIITFLVTFQKCTLTNCVVVSWLCKFAILFLIFSKTNCSNQLNILYDTVPIYLALWELMLNRIAIKDSGIFIILILVIHLISPKLFTLVVIVLICIYIAIISSKLRLSIFKQNKNVYCAGAFDLTCIDHCDMFKKSLKYGNRLIVGVYDDILFERFTNTKPIMTLDERISQLECLKFIDQILIIDNADDISVNQHFINKYNIHVCISNKDDTDTKILYKYPNDIGILVHVPYNHNILNNTNLINRIKSMK
jgi:glycerol-3-phosphate cytidylyltransferase-like family protein